MTEKKTYVENQLTDTTLTKDALLKCIVLKETVIFSLFE